MCWGGLVPVPGCPLLQVPAAQVYLLLKIVRDGLRFFFFLIKTTSPPPKSETAVSDESSCERMKRRGYTQV